MSTLPAIPREHALRLQSLAEVIVRVGLNLQRGQCLLIAEPYELQGVARGASPLVAAVETATLAAGGGATEVIWGDAETLQRLAVDADWPGLDRLLAGNTRRMERHLEAGGAFLFLIGSHPGLLHGIGAQRANQLQHASWRHFAPVVQRLMQGETQWTLAPAPSPEWAAAVFADLPADGRLPALWNAVFSACRCDQPDPTGAWRAHLGGLAQWRDTLNARRAKTLRYVGEGTDLTVKLPSGHVWCSAALSTGSGVPFVQNLPTEEVFTAPHKDSAEGTVRVSRPVAYAGTAIDGIELEFRRGRVIRASARRGADLLQRLLDTDDGSGRLGEVALVPTPDVATRTWRSGGRHYHHPLLDENAANHIALGEGYASCLDSLFSGPLNRSLVHVDLPLDAQAVLEPA